VYDICNDSDFPDAPTVIENEYDYWIGQGDLEVSVDWTEDTVSAEQTGYDCSPFSISSVFDSADSTLNPDEGAADSYDANPLVNSVAQVGISNKLKVKLDQPDLSGILKFDLEISSEFITDPSPTGVFTLDVHSCSVKEEDWAVK